MERGDFNGAIQSFKRARDQSRSYASQTLMVISLVSDLMTVLHCIETTCNLYLTDIWMEV